MCEINKYWCVLKSFDIIVIVICMPYLVVCALLKFYMSITSNSLVKSNNQISCMSIGEAINYIRGMISKKKQIVIAYIHQNMWCHGYIVEILSLYAWVLLNQILYDGYLLTICYISKVKCHLAINHVPNYALYARLSKIA